MPDRSRMAGRHMGQGKIAKEHSREASGSVLRSGGDSRVREEGA